jgi:arylsulfatase A-like enzyme/Tfp pilus assembly protein PilF
MRRRLWIAGSGIALVLAALWVWPRRPPHILLITLDTTRADRLGCYGYSAARTAALDELAASGVLCENACTVAPLTLPAHVSLFTGLYPAESGVRTNGRGRLDAGIPTLAEALKRAGYECGAFLGSFVLDRKFGLERGFKAYDDDIVGDVPAADALHRQRPGQEVVDSALDWLKRERSSPFFCWVHLYDPHAPYLAHDDLFGDEFADRPYDAEIAYVDRQVGRLIEFLKSSGLSSQTLVIVVGDHGEGFGEHVELGHGMTLYEEVLRVPLVVSQPGRVPPGRRIAPRVSLVDLSPTILELAGLSEQRKISGKSFRRGLLGGEFESSPCYSATDEPFLSNGWSPLRSLVDGTWKYVRTTKTELYDLAADPLERQNLAESLPEKIQALEAALARFESQRTARSESAAQLSPAERRALEGLGYLGASRPVPAGPAPADLPDVKDMLPLNIAVEEAGSLISEGAPEGAIERLRDVIRQAPGLTKAYWLLSTALKESGRLDEAASVLLDLLAVKPESREGHFGLGLVLSEQRQTDEALAEFRKTIEIDPDYPDAHFSAALLLMQTGRMEDALAQLNETLELDRCQGAAYQWRAFLLAQRGQTDKAVADYRKALRFTPESAPTHHNLGVLLQERGEAGQAEQHLARAVTLDPQNAEFRYALGSLLVKERRPGEAIPHLNRALELKPDYERARERLEEARRAARGEPRGAE